MSWGVRFVAEAMRSSARLLPLVVLHRLYALHWEATAADHPTRHAGMPHHTAPTAHHQTHTKVKVLAEIERVGYRVSAMLHCRQTVARVSERIQVMAAAVTTRCTSASTMLPGLGGCTT